MSLRLVLVGPPGAGKGTQAELISNHWKIPAISTGSILRANVKAGTELGKQAEALIAAGEFVPDDVITELVRDHLHEHAVHGFILDGFPRSVPQVDALRTMLEEFQTPLDGAILLEVPDDELIDRLHSRAQAEGRADDTREVIAHRMDVYHERTQPILEAFDKRGLLVRIDGVGSVDEVHQRILDATGQMKAARTQGTSTDSGCGCTCTSEGN